MTPSSSSIPATLSSPTGPSPCLYFGHCPPFFVLPSILHSRLPAPPPPPGRPLHLRAPAPFSSLLLPPSALQWDPLGPALEPGVLFFPRPWPPNLESVPGLSSERLMIKWKGKQEKGTERPVDRGEREQKAASPLSKPCLNRGRLHWIPFLSPTLQLKQG